MADFYVCHPKKDLYIPLADFRREVFNDKAGCCDAGRVACVALDGHQAGWPRPGSSHGFTTCGSARC